MLQALINGVLTTPQKNFKGKCQFCGDVMIAKCGTMKIAHWAHKVRECDEWQVGKETEWHINWKKTVGLDFAEKKLIREDRFHIADILIPDKEGKIDLIIEFQNSPLSQIEILEREKFYGDRLIWILNGTNLDDKFTYDDSFSSHKISDWHFKLTLEPNFFPQRSTNEKSSYVLKSSYFQFDKDFEEFILKQGFIKDEETFLTINQIKKIGLKPYQKVPERTYYMPIKSFDFDVWLDFKLNLSKKIYDFFRELTKDEREEALKQDIIKDVKYKWKNARKHYNIAKRPVYIDLNDNYIFQVHNSFVEGSSDGKLIKKDRFIERIKERTKYSQLSFKF